MIGTRKATAMILLVGVGMGAGCATKSNSNLWGSRSTETGPVKSMRDCSASELRILEEFNTRKRGTITAVNDVLAKRGLTAADGAPLYLQEFKLAPSPDCPDGSSHVCACCTDGRLSCCCPPCDPCG